MVYVFAGLLFGLFVSLGCGWLLALGCGLYVWLLGLVLRFRFGLGVRFPGFCEYTLTAYFVAGYYLFWGFLVCVLLALWFGWLVVLLGLLLLFRVCICC